MLIAAVRRGERVLVPGGSDRVEPGERVLIVTSAELAPRIDGILER
jgi:Trk K+ transport system NAD-binding subunit